MNKEALVHALLPTLILQLPNPFDPDEQRAKKCLVAASGWADEILKAAHSDAEYNVFFL